MPISPTLPARRRLPLAAALLAWSALILMGALASYGDAQQAASGAPVWPAVLRFVLLHLPLALASTLVVLGLERLGPGWRQPARLLLAWGLAGLAALPLLVWGQGAVNHLFSGKAWINPWALLRQQEALLWWFDALVWLLAAGVHLAYNRWRHAHAQALAWQRAQQDNLALRLRLLQGQLEPYFLSAALAGIARLSRAGERSLAVRALARLSDLLRYALRASRADWQSVADEAQFLRDYADLQSLCRGGDLALAWQWGAGDWHGVRCPPLLLFPLLEQALDGWSGPSAAAAVSIRIDQLAGDAGPQVQVQVDYPCAAASGQRAALAALEPRLAMLYHGAASLTMGAEGGRACLQLRYPLEHHDD